MCCRRIMKSDVCLNGRGRQIALIEDKESDKIRILVRRGKVVQLWRAKKITNNSAANGKSSYCLDSLLFLL